MPKFPQMKFVHGSSYTLIEGARCTVCIGNTICTPTHLVKSLNHEFEHIILLDIAGFEATKGLDNLELHK